MSLTPEQRDRYSRMIALRDFSEEDMKSIMTTKVTVVGAGGLGSPCLRLLAAIGFGHIRIVDRDVVELSNIQRQTIYNTSDIGRPKAEAAAENLKLLNPEVTIEPICASIEDGTVDDILKGSDIVVDGLDSFHSRRYVNEAVIEQKTPYVFAGAVEYYGNISTFIPGKTGCLNCVIGDAKDDPENTCERIGVTPTLLSIVSAIQVREVVSIATGKNVKLANRLMTVDIASLSFDIFDVHRNDSCPVCSLVTPKREPEAKSLSVVLMCAGSYSVSPTSLLSLNLDIIENRVKKKYKVLRKKRHLVISSDSGLKVTLMSSGTAVVRGARSPDHAIEVYRYIVFE